MDMVVGLHFRCQILTDSNIQGCLVSTIVLCIAEDIFRQVIDALYIKWRMSSSRHLLISPPPKPEVRSDHEIEHLLPIIINDQLSQLGTVAKNPASS